MSDYEEEMGMEGDDDFVISDSDSSDSIICDSDDEQGSRGRSTTKRKKGKIKCNLCSRFYKDISTFPKHLGKRALKDLLEHNRPCLSAHRQFCRSVYVDVLQAFLAMQPESGMTTEIKEFVKRLLSMPLDTITILVDQLADKLWECLPAPALMDVGQLHCAFRKNVNELLSNNANRTILIDILRSDLLGLTCTAGVLDWFLCEFTRKLGVKSDVFCVRCLREPYEGMCKDLQRDDPDDINFQQSVHYIGGSTVRSVMLKAQKGLGTKDWSDIYDCMLNKFVVREGMDGPGEDIEAWTNRVDRGGLQHINAKVWSFLIALSCTLKKEEGEDGSILHKNVFQLVTADDVIMFLWNDITQNYLVEKVDLMLLQNFCQFFTNAWLRGVILRRKNAIPNVSRDKAALRARLTR